MLKKEYSQTIMQIIDNRKNSINILQNSLTKESGFVILNSTKEIKPNQIRRSIRIDEKQLRQSFLEVRSNGNELTANSSQGVRSNGNI